MFRCGIVCFILFNISNVWCSEQKGQMIFSLHDLTTMQSVMVQSKLEFCVL